MSRLQKKKGYAVKKKKNSNLDKKVQTDEKPVVLSSSSSSQKIKTKFEKNLSTDKVESLNFFQKAIIFMREVKIELSKVIWPTRKQVTGTTLVVIVFIFIVAAFLGVFDYSLSKLVQLVLT